ncbi:MAG: spermidine synthase [Gemmatimonadaceae bacterium]|nr:spermidine synthase [Gemmatimonadaceae bacterium]
MKPTETLATATAPDGSRLTLYRHDGAYLMVVNGIELMSTRRTHSEVRLAELVCALLGTAPAPSVLIGGLGFGATLAAALRLLPADATVTVAELVADVIAWNRHPEWALAGESLVDPRVRIVHADVAHVLRTSIGAYDAIMMDVDNGAESFTTGSNRKLYNESGIRAAIAALKPGGQVAYWSVDSEPAFVRALKRLGLSVAVHRTRSHATSGGFNSIIVATSVR